MTNMAELPSGMTVIERGWLSANSVLFQEDAGTALVDSGYCTHSDQTTLLVRHALGGRPLDLLLNTHLHSDHCGGNAAMQANYPALLTHIPPGQAKHVGTWDPVALSFVPTGQQCPRFRFDSLLVPSTELRLGGLSWQIHASPGHDPHSIILFEPASRTLIAADALWENGFGVVFQELEGESAFQDVAATLDLIETLNPHVVIPGHGKVFTHVAKSIDLARTRLDVFISNPRKHANHAAKVLLKFKLLELQRLRLLDFARWAENTPYFSMVHTRWDSDMSLTGWVEQLVGELVRSGAAKYDGAYVLNV